MNTPARRESVPLPWDAIECYYRMTTIPLTQIARDFGIPSTALRNKIRQGRWTRNDQLREAAPARKSQMLASRLAAIVASELAQIGRQLNAPRTERAPKLVEVERLARLVQRIAELENMSTDAEPTSADEPRVIDDARRLELARRLEGIRRQLEYERDAQRADLD